MKIAHFVPVVSITVASILAGCAPLALTAVGLGGSAAMNHTLMGITYKTFTAPLPRVKTASIGALHRMGIKATGAVKQERNEIVTAIGKDRDIEIVLEPISSNATRMRVTARNGGVLYDSATATEIIMQTERILGNT